jgi:hypothetical protein
MPTSTPDNEVEYRGVYASDLSFIFDSWLRSWRNSPWAGCIPNNEYYPMTRSAIEQLVGRGAEFKVACLKADPERILGWICHELTGPDAVVHYLYVKDPYLTLGIGDALVASIPGNKPGFYTYRYRQVSEACQHAAGWRHAPEIARRK